MKLYELIEKYGLPRGGFISESTENVSVTKKLITFLSEPGTPTYTKGQYFSSCSQMRDNYSLSIPELYLNELLEVFKDVPQAVLNVIHHVAVGNIPELKLSLDTYIGFDPKDNKALIETSKEESVCDLYTFLKVMDVKYVLQELASIGDRAETNYVDVRGRSVDCNCYNAARRILMERQVKELGVADIKISPSNRGYTNRVCRAKKTDTSEGVIAGLYYITNSPYSNDSFEFVKNYDLVAPTTGRAYVNSKLEELVLLETESLNKKLPVKNFNLNRYEVYPTEGIFPKPNTDLVEMLSKLHGINRESAEVLVELICQ